MAKKLGKRARSLIALGGAAVVLLGAYLLITLLPGEEEEPPAPEEESIVLYACGKEDITGFTLDTAEGSWSVEIDWQANADGDAEALYTLKGYPDVPVNAATAEGVLTNASNLQAVGVVEAQTPEDLAPYGLDPSAATVAIDLAGGGSETFYLGNKTGAGDSYYMMKQGDPAVYEVKLLYGNRFSYTLDDLVKTDVMPVLNTVSLERLVLKREAQPDIEAKTYTTPEDQARIGVSGFKIISPFDRPRDIDAETFDGFLQNIGAVKISGIVSLDEADRGQYGLTEPRMELLAKDAENTLHFYIGGDYGDSQVCCMVEGYPPIYAVDKDSISFLESVDAPYLADKFLLLPLIDDVEKIDVAIGGNEYSMAIERHTEEAGEEGAEDKVIETFFLDGIQKDDSSFRKAYQAVIGLTADAYADDPALAEGETQLSITYHFNKPESPPITVSCHAYDADFYAGAVDGGTQALVAKRKLDKIADAMTALAESEYTEE